jgi:GTP-binding protein
MSQKSLPKVLLIGRPNVGKSTLFNRLCGKRIAIVDDMPGVTRDIKMHHAELDDLQFIAMDTAGWTSEDDLGVEPRLQSLMSNTTEGAISEANVILFVVDGIGGITVEDIGFADKVRKTHKDVIVLVNKSEAGDKRTKADKNDLYKLGLGDPVYISAMHGTGLEDLYMRLTELLPKSESVEEFTPAEELDESIKISIVGRPNVGKSTLFNCLLGRERSIVSDVSGTTRDAITDEIEIEFNESPRQLVLIDTAGMRKKSKIDEDIESRALGQSITAIRRSNVVILVMDATAPFEKQDLTIAKIAVNEGKGLVFAVNKIDLLDRDIRQQIAQKLDEIAYNYLESIEQIPIVYLSALEGKYIHLLLQNTVKIFDRWQTQISTGQLNKWLKDVTTSRMPPLMKSRKVPISIKYMTQKSTQPPTFMLFANTTKIPTSYIRYMKRSLARRFNMEGIPIRLYIKTTNNPYVK